MAKNIPNLEWKVIKRPEVPLNPHIFGDYEEDSSDDDNMRGWNAPGLKWEHSLPWGHFKLKEVEKNKKYLIPTSICGCGCGSKLMEDEKLELEREIKEVKKVNIITFLAMTPKSPA